jgi:hypothetical protein
MFGTYELRLPAHLNVAVPIPLTRLVTRHVVTRHVCRLVTKKAQAMFVGTQLAAYMRDPSARAGLGSALDGITPDYQQLSKWLQQNEWPTNVYVSQYKEAIYELS